MPRIRDDDVRINLSLKVELTATDKILWAERCALLEKEQEDLELEKKSNATFYKGEIDKRVSERRVKAEEYRQGFRWESVDCVRERDMKQGKAYTVRLDTGETVETRKLTPAEKQDKLPI